MKKPINPTLEDVARAAKVSTATISRSINNPDKVANTTRDRIQNVIRELGYTPNSGGRMLASHRSNIVGALIPTMANAMFASALQSFQEELSEYDVTLLVASTGYNGEHELKQIRSLLSRGADGLLLIGTSRPPESSRFLTIRQVPHVISWCYQSNSKLLFAGFDNHKAAYQMTMQVLKTGHRRIAMIAGISKGNDRASKRIEGVSSAIADYGNGAELINTIETSYSQDNGGQAFEELMSASEKPTAVICGNDVLAAGAIVRARTLTVAVPQEVSITGFDDIGIARAVYPALTTVRVPQQEMGRTAARLLMDLLFKERTPSSIEFDTEIVLRDSLAAPMKT
ncbi:MAG: LacI family DNA-binding transcriptional regulator [Granulosicoccus sp.]